VSHWQLPCSFWNQLLTNSQQCRLGHDCCCTAVTGADLACGCDVPVGCFRTACATRHISGQCLTAVWACMAPGRTLHTRSVHESACPIRVVRSSTCRPHHS
jgi:hypothetical protein